MIAMGWSSVLVRGGLVMRAASLLGVALLGALVAGCGDEIDGAPTCNKGQLSLTGAVGGDSAALTEDFSDSSLDQKAGELALTLSGGLDFTLTWTPNTETGSATAVSGQVTGVPNGPLCYGGESQILLDSESITFQLEAFHAC